jgi:hypothetical protein
MEIGDQHRRSPIGDEQRVHQPFLRSATGLLVLAIAAATSRSPSLVIG